VRFNSSLALHTRAVAKALGLIVPGNNNTKLTNPKALKQSILFPKEAVRFVNTDTDTTTSSDSLKYNYSFLPFQIGFESSETPVNALKECIEMLERVGYEVIQRGKEDVTVRLRRKHWEVVHN